MKHENKNNKMVNSKFVKRMSIRSVNNDIESGYNAINELTISEDKSETENNISKLSDIFYRFLKN